MTVASIAPFGPSLALDGARTKNCKPTLQPVTRQLLVLLEAETEGKPDNAPLLAMPSAHTTAHNIARDFKKVKVTTETKAGKVVALLGDVNDDEYDDFMVSTQDESRPYLVVFNAVDLGYQRGDAVSNFVNKIDEPSFTSTYISLLDQIWSHKDKIEDVTERLCEHIASVYQENSPERIYFLMLFNIFTEFLDDINEDVLPNDLTGYQDSLIWKKLYNFQRDAATSIINKLETYNGCILADSVGLGKTFSALPTRKTLRMQPILPAIRRREPARQLRRHVPPLSRLHARPGLPAFLQNRHDNPSWLFPEVSCNQKPAPWPRRCHAESSLPPRGAHFENT